MLPCYVTAGYLNEPALPTVSYLEAAAESLAMFLQESELTPTGANLLDGRYAVFGYLIDGATLLQQAQVPFSTKTLHSVCTAK